MGIGDAPGGAVEQQAGEVGGQDLRPREGFEGAGRRLRPQPIADARLGPPRAAAPLVHRGAGGAGGDEAGQADAGLVERHARQTGIDDDPNPLDRQRRLGDAGRQHDLPGSGRSGRHGAVLFGRGKGTVEGRDLGALVDPLGEERRDPPDLALSGQEGEDRAGIGPQGAKDGVGHRILDPPVRIALRMACLHRKGPPLGFDDPRVAHQARDPGTVQGGGHDEDPEIVAETTLGVEREGETEIGRRASARGTRRRSPRRCRTIPDRRGSLRVKTPSVTTSIRVAREIFEPRRTRRPTVSPTRWPRVAAMRSAAPRAARRRGSRRMIRPRRRAMAHREAPADASGLAGSGRCHEHRRRTGFERREKARQGRIDREGSREEGVRRHRGWGGAGKR